MSRKKETNKTVDNGEPKQKKSVCCSCCAGAIIFILVVAVIGGVAGWIIGDRFLKTRYDVSMSQVADSFFSLRHYNEGRIITNSYGETSEEEVYGALKKALFLKDSTPFSLEELMGHILGSDDAAGETAAVLSALAEGEQPPEGKESELTQYLASILTYENIDVQRLSAYDEAHHGDYVLNLTDKQLARALDVGLRYALTLPEFTSAIDKQLSQLGLTADALDLKNNLTVGQAVFYKEGEDSRIKLTLCVGWRKLSNKIINKADLSQSVNLDNGFNKFAVSAGKTLAKGLLTVLTPKKIFLTADISVTPGTAPRLAVNNATDEELTDIFRFVKNISGGSADLQAAIDKPFTDENGAVKKLLASAGKFQDLTQAVGDGTLSLDVVETGIESLKLNYDKAGDDYVLKPEAQRVHSADVYYGLSAVFGATADDVIGENGSKTAYDYNNIKLKFDESGKLLLGDDGLPQFDYIYKYAAQLAAQDKDILDEYKRGLVSLFGRAYGLSPSVDFDELLDTFMMGKMDTDSLLKMFDADKLKAVVGGEAEGAVISDRMLAAVVSSSMDKFLGTQAQDIAGKIELKYIILSREEDREFMELGIYLKVGEFLSGNAATLIGGLLPEGFIFSAKIDITLGAADFTPSTVTVNDSPNTSRVLKLLDSFGAFKDENGENCTTIQYLDRMLLPVRDTLIKMHETLPGLKLGTSKLMLPDVYTAIAAAVNNGLEDEEKLESEQLAKALKLLISEMPDNDYADVAPEEYAEYEAALIAQLESKLALSFDNPGGGKYTLGEMLEKLGVDGGSGSAEGIVDAISGERLEALVESESIEGLRLTDFSTGTDMLAVLLREVVGNFIDDDLAQAFGSENIRAVCLDEQNGRLYLELFMTVDLVGFLPKDGPDAVIDFIAKLLPDAVLLSCGIDITPGEEHDKTMVKYNLSEDSDVVFEVTDKLGVELPFEQMADNVRRAVDTLRGSDKLSLEFTAGEVVSEDIFSVVDKLVFESGCSAEQIQKALRALYRTSAKNIGSFFDDKIVNTPAADYSAFMDDLSGKYFLKVAAADFDELLSFIDSRKGNISADVFDIERLTRTPLACDELRPVMSYADMGALLKERLGKETVITPLSVAYENGRLLIYAEVSLDDYLTTASGDIDFTKMITVSSLYVKLRVDTSNTIIDSDGESYYPVEAAVNDMTNEEFDVLCNLVRKYNDNLAVSVNANAVEAGKAVYSALRTAEDNIPGGCEFTAGGLRFIDPFGFIAKTLAGGQNLSGDGVKEALQGMYAARDIGDSAYNYRESDLVFNQIAAEAPTIDRELAENGITDCEMGAYVDRSVKDVNFGEVRQFSILPKGDTSAAVVHDREYLNGFRAGSVSANETAVLITARMDIAKMGTVAAGAADVMPSEIYVTFAMIFNDAAQKFEYNGFFRINRLTAAAQSALLKIAGVDESKITDAMTDNSGQVIAPVNELIDGFANIPFVTVKHLFVPSAAGTSRGTYKITVAV